MESAHLTNLFTYQGPLKHVDHTHRRPHAVPTGRGNGLGPDNDGSLASIPEDHWRRQKSDQSLATDLAYATHKEAVFRDLLEFAKGFAHKSNYVQRQIRDDLPGQITEEVEEIHKLNVEITRRRAEGVWGLA